MHNDAYDMCSGEQENTSEDGRSVGAHGEVRI
jgi:hypothetical protein